MADESTELQLSKETPNAAEHNAEVALKLADQGKESNIPKESPETFDALDALRNQKQKEKQSAEAATNEEGDKEKVVVEPKPDDKPAEEVEKPTVEEKKEDKPAEPAVSDDIFKDIALPPKASLKSAEAFEAVKSSARAEIASLNQKLAENQKQLADVQEKIKNPIPAELLKEIEELRAFRAKLDVEADPKFKQYDKQISDTHDFIYSQLTKTGVITKEHIDQIKKYGGPENVNLDKIFEAVNDPLVKRIVEAKLADVEMLKHQKQQAISSTKDNVQAYLKEQEEAFSKSSKSHNEETQKRVAELTAKLDWVKEKPVPAKADDAVKAEIAGYNKFVVETNQDLQAALNDDSPEMRAILVVGMGQLLHTKRLLEAKNADYIKLETELKEANTKLERFKKASVRVESGASTSHKPVEKPKSDFNVTAAESLDAARAKILEEKRTAATA